MTDMSEPKEKPAHVELEQRQTARALADVLGGKVVPRDPNVKPEHRRILYRPGDNVTVH